MGSFRKQLTATLLALGVAFAVGAAAAESEPVTKARRALVIGINQYVHRGHGAGSRALRNLQGAVNDAEAIGLLLRSGYSFEVQLLLDGAATRTAILSAIENHLVKPCTKGDELVFFFAGHGSQVINSASPEPDGKDETIVPADAASGAADIRDKELRRLFSRLLDRGGRLTVILDCCHSGSGVRGLPDERRTRWVMPMAGDVADEDPPGPTLEERDTLVLSAAQDFERAAETGYLSQAREHVSPVPHGAFTFSLLSALRAAARDEPASRVLMRAHSRMQAEGFLQQPVLAGSEEMRNAPLFGGRAHEHPAVAAVLAVAEDGSTIHLEGGWANGLSPGCELRLVSREHSESGLRVRIEMAELTHSTARIIEDTLVLRSAAQPVQLTAGDLFELERWVVPEQASLQVWIPEICITATQLQALAVSLAQIAEQDPAIEWVEDPVERNPTHIIRWEHDSWWLLREGQRIELGRRPETEDLQRLLRSPVTAGTRLYVQLPVPCTLGCDLQLGEGTANDAVELVTKPADAVYILSGRLRNGALEYSWIRPGVLAGDVQTSSLPLGTRWLTLEEGEAGARELGTMLRDKALRLAKVRAWLTLESPPSSVFPYHLALRDAATGTLRIGDLGRAEPVDRTRPGNQDRPAIRRRLIEGERYGLVLVHRPASSFNN